MITIKEIAQLANLSIGTVDRVLHGRGRVSKTTEARIRTIVRNTGYKTNIHARNLSLRATHEFVAIIPYSERDSDYWEILKKGIDQATGEFASFNVRRQFFYFDRYSEASFLEAGKMALDSNPGGLIIAPVLVDACRTFVASLPQGLPYVYVDSTIPDTQPLTFIGQNPFRSGLAAGRLMHTLVADNGTVAVLRMLPNNYHIDERVKGFLSYFEKNGFSGPAVFDLSGRCDDEEFAQKVETIVRDVPDCRGFFVTNAAAYRVVRALKTLQYTTSHIIGYDCIEENRRLLAEGSIDFIISQSTRQQGYGALNSLYRHLVLKEPISPEIPMPIDVIMAENLIDYSLRYEDNGKRPV